MRVVRNNLTCKQKVVYDKLDAAMKAEAAYFEGGKFFIACGFGTKEIISNMDDEYITLQNKVNELKLQLLELLEQ